MKVESGPVDKARNWNNCRNVRLIPDWKNSDAHAPKLQAGATAAECHILTLIVKNLRYGVHGVVFLNTNIIIDIISLQKMRCGFKLRNGKSSFIFYPPILIRTYLPP